MWLLIHARIKINKGGTSMKKHEHAELHDSDFKLINNSKVADYPSFTDILIGHYIISETKTTNHSCTALEFGIIYINTVYTIEAVSLPLKEVQTKEYYSDTHPQWFFSLIYIISDTGSIQFRYVAIGKYVNATSPLFQRTYTHHSCWQIAQNYRSLE